MHSSTKTIIAEIIKTKPIHSTSTKRDTLSKINIVYSTESNLNWAQFKVRPIAKTSVNKVYWSQSIDTLKRRKSLSNKSPDTWKCRSDAFKEAKYNSNKISSPKKSKLNCSNNPRKVAPHVMKLFQIGVPPKWIMEQMNSIFKVVRLSILMKKV